MATTAAIVVPAYRKYLEPQERAGLTLSLGSLRRFPWYWVIPESMRLPPWDLPGGVQSQVVALPDHHFQDVAAYSRLLLSPSFYRLFARYEFILIHQTDAIVLRDELDYWCSCPIDYVGAPWRSPWSLADLHLPLGFGRRFYVGNGGLSLRRVSAFRFLGAAFRPLARKWLANEDLFWSVAVPGYWPFFRVPQREVALRFAWEEEPQACLNQSGGRLPFGSHAWRRYGEAFWINHFPALAPPPGETR